MADISDVENGLVALLAGALFPTIQYLPGDLQTSAANLPTRLYRGWPEQAAMTADLSAGRANVSVFSTPGLTRNVSRWQPTAQTLSAIAPTITAFASGATVTIGGTVTAGNVVGVQCGSPPAAYAYVVRQTDTLTTVAQSLAGKVPGASAVGSVVTLPNKLNVAARVMMPQTVGTVTDQQQQGVVVTIWAPTPQARDALGSLVQGAIAGMKNANGFLTRFFSVTQYEQAMIRFQSNTVNDVPARDNLWRRDIRYMIEYPTTVIEQDPIMLFGGGTLSIGSPVAGTQQIGDAPPS